jgi:excisionase family DNA binding protein
MELPGHRLPGRVEELLMHNRTTRNTPRPFVSVEEAALLLGEARSTVYRSVKAGTFPLPVVRIGARIRIPRIAIARLIAGEDPRLSYQDLRLSKG